MRLLDHWYDPALDIDLRETPESIVAQEVYRLQGELAAAQTAASFPRRLGNAGRAELSLDKKRSRRIAHVLRQSLLSWGGTPRAATEDEERLGIQVYWADWYEQHGVVVSERLRYITTWSRKSAHIRFGKTAVVRLSQELEWLDYAMRD